MQEIPLYVQLVVAPNNNLHQVINSQVLILAKQLCMILVLKIIVKMNGTVFTGVEENPHHLQEILVALSQVK